MKRTLAGRYGIFALCALTTGAACTKNEVSDTSVDAISKAFGPNASTTQIGSATLASTQTSSSLYMPILPIGQQGQLGVIGSLGASVESDGKNSEYTIGTGWGLGYNRHVKTKGMDGHIFVGATWDTITTTDTTEYKGTKYLTGKSQEKSIGGAVGFSATANLNGFLCGGGCNKKAKAKAETVTRSNTGSIAHQVIAP